MGRWVLLDAAGDVAAQVVTRPGRSPWQDGSNPAGLREVRVRRFGGPHERFDGEGWRIDPERQARQIDVEHAQRAGAHAIAVAHATKAIEARLILAGVAIDGLLAAEARATGQPLAELARIVAAKAADAELHEINRIAAKRAARAAQE